jgi:hypothetical protein
VAPGRAQHAWPVCSHDTVLYWSWSLLWVNSFTVLIRVGYTGRFNYACHPPLFAELKLQMKLKLWEQLGR